MLISETIERLERHKETFGDQEMVFYTPDRNEYKEWHFMILSESDDICEVLLNAY